MGERAEKLGFSPQKDSIYNTLLHYGDKLHEESLRLLAEIKTNLGKAILCQDLRDITFWCNQLSKYIRLYGRKFSKADHVQFIQVCYELLIMPGLELSFVKKIAILLNTLIKKVELLSREDLSIPWRPLYKLYEAIFFSSYESYGMVLIPSNLESHLKNVIKCCNPYFPVESTEEILEELKPLMCPFDTEMAKAINYFEMFLCTSLPPSEHHRGFKLWFDDFMTVWQKWHNIPTWENTLLFLFSRLAKDNIGYVNWEPHIPMLFTRLLRSFNLPGRSSMVQVLRAVPTFDTNAVTTLIASMLGNGSSCQLHISRLFKALESFYHPSNHGRWLAKMQKLLQKLPNAVISRLHRERHKKPSWRTPIPDEAKLSDQEVTDFVKSVVSAALLSMFSKRGCVDSAVAMQNLGTLRPELVIPPLLEGLYSSLETLTEPHRLTAAMHCIVPVCRPLVQRNKYFPEGPRHVIPLLMAALPGIDPNDIKKCMMTFQFISILATLVLFIDCSSAANNNDLPEHVQEVCLSTAAFEDFVLQFMDRIFVLIENSCLENPSRLDRDSERTNPEENYLEIGLCSTFGIVIMQSSPEIYQVALSKLQTFVTSHIFETNVSGKFAANLCRCMSRANPDLGLKAFVPHFSKLVLALTESEEIFNEEKLDDELLFSLLILAEVVRCDGKYLLKYQDCLVQVLERALKLKCKEGYTLACSILKQVLKMYTSSFPIDTCSVPDPWNRHSKEELHLYLEDWGKPGNIHDLQINYHHPSDEEIAAAKFLLEKFLCPQIELLNDCALKCASLNREILHRSLTIVLNCLVGAASCLPMWIEEQLPLETTLPSYHPKPLECGSKDIDINGENVRQVVCGTIRKLYEYFNKCCEDDTKGLFIIIKIYHTLIFNWGIEKEEFESRRKSLTVIKNIIEDKLHGQKKHIRTLLVDRVHAQHEMRIAEKYKLYYTETHRLLMKDLMNLATSHYSEVRKSSQVVLHNCLVTFYASYKSVFPKVIEFLQKDPTTYHEEFKGVLHVILGHKHSNFLKMHDWDLVSELFPAIVASKHSEKPSIIRLLESVSTYLQKYLPTFQLKFQVSESCLNLAKGFWSDNKPLPLSPCFSDEEILLYSEKQVKFSEFREKRYFDLLHSLMDLMKNNSLHWRHYHLALAMLVILIRPDVKAPQEEVQLFVSHLVHDTLAVRKLAMQGLTCTMKQQKRKHPKMVIDPTVQNPKKLTLHPLMPKIDDDLVPDNFWMEYNSANLPDTQEKWDSRHFVHKTHWGFFTWPKKFEVYAPESEQPKLDRTPEEMTEEERPIYEAFSQPKFVDSLISYFSLEEKKDQDKFDAKKYYLFRSLFGNYGDSLVPLFVDHLNRMVEDKQESVQRCAAEILAGILSGSKHWNFQKMENLKALAIPLFEKIVHNVTPETLADWSTALGTVSQSKDPNKYYWIFEFFMKEPPSVENGSFLESSWLFLLSTIIAQQEWRVFELLHRALDYVLPRLDHSYQNVREKLGSFLVYIFLFDIPLGAKIMDFAPKRQPFLDSLMPKFNVLLTNAEVDENSIADVIEESPERKSAKNLFRTILRWISLNGSKSLFTAPPNVLKFLPVLCHMMNDTTDESFQRECRVALAILGQAFLTSESINASIKILQNIALGNSWHSRVSASAYLQTMVFSNLYSVMCNETWTKDIYGIVLKMLQDENVEVRESTAETLCGFLHCEFFKITDELLNVFKRKCQKKLKHKESTINNGPKTFEPEGIRERHAGILGLCACVNAYPYDVPEFLPDILVLLGDHLNDPQPISATIKKTLSSFRRTHHDNWRDHKLKFTDDQLAVITDLLVSPSYYA